MFKQYFPEQQHFLIFKWYWHIQIKIISYNSKFLLNTLYSGTDTVLYWNVT